MTTAPVVTAKPAGTLSLLIAARLMGTLLGNRNSVRLVLSLLG